MASLTADNNDERKEVGALLDKHLLDFWKGRLLRDYPLARLSTFKVGGPAKAVVFPENIGQLSQLVNRLQSENIPYRVLGRGSNILAPDTGYPGVIIILGQGFSFIEQVSVSDQHHMIRAGAGCSLTKLVNWTIDQGLAGIEFAVGIPGTVGGAVVMNAGAWGRELRDVLCSVEIIDRVGDQASIDGTEIPFSYRTWGLPMDRTVVAATFRLTRDIRADIENRCRAYQQRRKSSQPLGVSSAGSFFKNPAGLSAGKLIEDAGLKGCRIGGAQVSPVHANFIVNTGNATAKDIFELMQLIQEKVYNDAGVQLEPEVHLLKD